MLEFRGRIPSTERRFRQELSRQRGRWFKNPIDFDEVADVNIAKAVGGIKFDHIKGYDAFSAQKSNDARIGNSIYGNIRSIHRELISDCEFYRICENLFGIRFPSADWGDV